MEFNILYALQSIHNPVLDQFFLILTKIMGSYGQIWLLLAVILILFKKTRKAGICIVVSYLLVLITGQFILKDLIARPRPCHLDQTIRLLVERPDSYSCPSTHSAWAFAGATSIFLYHKKSSIIAFIVAALMAFSRLYLFVHFPTDVLIGVIMGILLAIVAKLLVEFFAKKIELARSRKSAQSSNT